MIKGKRITLRALEREDIQKIWEWENDSEVMEFAASAPERCISLDTVTKIYEGSACPDSNNPIRYMILNEKNEKIGIVSYWIPNPRFFDSIEVGIYIGEKQYWHKGYATEALMTLGRVLFHQLNVNRISLVFGSHNFRVKQGLEKYGVVVEGIIRRERFLNGQYYDTIRMGVLREEFDEIYKRWIADQKGVK